MLLALCQGLSGTCRKASSTVMVPPAPPEGSVTVAVYAHVSGRLRLAVPDTEMAGAFAAARVTGVWLDIAACPLKIAVACARSALTVDPV